MDNHLVALKLILETADMSLTGYGSVNKSAIQSAINLSQYFGVPKNYEFRLTMTGIYSSSLNEDIYELNSSIAAGKRVDNDIKLTSDIRDSVHRMVRSMRMPEEVKCTRADWYFACSNYTFLIRDEGYNGDKADDFCRKNLRFSEGLLASVKETLENANLPKIEIVLENAM